MSMLTPPEVRGINTVLLSDGGEIHLDDIATAAQGQSVLDDLDAAIDKIEAQIERCRAGLWVAPDDDWSRRAGIALKRKRRIRPRLQQRIGELRRAERQEAAKHADGDGQRRAFVLAAADMLDHELVTEIWTRAKEMRPAAFTRAAA